VDVWKKTHHFVIDRLLAPSADVLIAVSGEVREFYESHRVAKGRWTVVYNGIDASMPYRRGRTPAYEALGIPAQAPVVGLIGRLVQAKAPSVFLEAVALVACEIPELRALVIGDGPLREEAERDAARLGVSDRTVWAGLRHDVPVLLEGMDVLCFSSTREGFSIAMLEAMAAGVPIVATRVGGNPELIDSDDVGFLVRPGSAAALAERIVALMRNPDLAERVRRAARARVERCFSLTAMVRTHESLYLGNKADAAP
jgi:glycosyltransferase involved in cell wall biosynthesis